MWGSSEFRWVHGNYTHYGVLKTTNLDLSAADANVGTIPRGKMMDIDPTPDLTEMSFGQGYAVGILMHNITLNGIGDDEGFKNFTIGKQDLPKKRGAAVSLRVPVPGSFAEFEGAPATAAIIDTLVGTSGTGAIGVGTAVGTALSVLNGAWYVAQIGDTVLARLVDPTLTPNTASNIRILVQFVAPVVVAA